MENEGIEPNEELPVLNIEMQNNFIIGNLPKKEDIMNIFGKLDNNVLSTKDNELYNKIYSETQIIYSYLMKSIEEFHIIFESNLNNFEDTLKYLEKIAVPNKCVCAGVIETIPGWRCIECSKYENAIYCSDCFIKSKHLHKNHQTYFLNSSGGMCDCGDPDSLYTFCPDHTGPFKNQKEINDYISKSFPKNILDNLLIFFDDFFIKFSKYFILTEKVKLFYYEIFNDTFNNQNQNNEKDDIILLNKNFCVVFQNFIHFLRLISQKNLGILHLIAVYLLKNHLEKEEFLEEDYITNHRCITITENEINIDYKNGESHVCKCPFLRLLISNWRESIKSKDNENEEFLLSFPHNLPLRQCFCILLFFLYKSIIYNNNNDILNIRYQFYVEDFTELIAKKSNLIEESYEIFYDYLKKYIKSSKLKDENGSIIEEQILNLKQKTQYIVVDTKYYSKPKMIVFV